VTECNTDEPWPEAWAAREDELLFAIDVLRALGVECGSGESVAERSVLGFDAPLRCFARQRSTNRSRNELPAMVSGFEGAEVVEVQTDADIDLTDLLVDFWVGGDSTDCSILMSEEFRAMEVGFAALSGQGYWTIAFIK